MAKRKRPGINRDEAKKQVDTIDQRKLGGMHELTSGKNWEWFFPMGPYGDSGKAWHEIEQHGGWLTCPARRKKGEACRLCRETQKRVRRGDASFEEEFKIKSKGLINAVRKSDIKEFPEDPKLNRVLKLSPKSFSDFINHVLDELDQDIDVTAPETAQLFGIKKTGSGMGTRYETKWGKVYDISAYATDEALDEGLYNLEMTKDALPVSDKKMREEIEKYDAENGTPETNDDTNDDFSDDEELAGSSRNAEPGDLDDLDDTEPPEEDTVFAGGDDDFSDLDDEESTPAPRRRKRA